MKRERTSSPCVFTNAKKGQVTLFIIIGLVLVVAVILFFVFKGSLKPEQPSFPEVERVSEFVYECTENVSKEVAYQVSSGGGYYFPPEFSTDSGIPIYYSDNKNYMPSLEQVENEISYYTSKRLFFCTKNFINFPELEIKQGEIKTETILESNNLILNVEYPLAISKANTSTTIKEVNGVKIPIRVYDVYEAVKEFSNQSSSEGICLSCLSKITDKYNLTVNMLDYDEETVLFIFKEENSKINNQTLKWVFANRYS